jgi:hypothetical protein
MTDIEQRAHDLAVEAASKCYDIEFQYKLMEAKAASEHNMLPIIKIDALTLYNFYNEFYKCFKEKLTEDQD